MTRSEEDSLRLTLLQPQHFQRRRTFEKVSSRQGHPVTSLTKHTLLETPVVGSKNLYSMYSKEPTSCQVESCINGTEEDDPLSDCSSEKSFVTSQSHSIADSSDSSVEPNGRLSIEMHETPQAPSKDIIQDDLCLERASLAIYSGLQHHSEDRASTNLYHEEKGSQTPAIRQIPGRRTAATQIHGLSDLTFSTYSQEESYPCDGKSTAKTSLDSQKRQTLGYPEIDGLPHTFDISACTSSLPQEPKRCSLLQPYDPERHDATYSIEGQTHIQQQFRENLDKGRYAQSWGSKFWYAIDQQEGQRIFANPITGECHRSLPRGAFVLASEPTGRWWELFDDKSKMLYYYQSGSGKTQWEHPDEFVVPMIAVQERLQGKKFSLSSADKDGIIVSKEAIDIEKEDIRVEAPKTEVLPKIDRATSPLLAPLDGEFRRNHRLANGKSNPSMLKQAPQSTGLDEFCNTKSLKHQSTTPEIRSRIDFEVTNVSTKRSYDKSVDLYVPYRRERDPIKRRMQNSIRTHNTGSNPTKIKELSGDRHYLIGDPAQNIHSNGEESKISFDSLSLIRLSPRSMSFKEYAIQHFTAHKSGMLRKKKSVKDMTNWQAYSLSSPLHSILDSETRKDAVKCFKIIMRAFGQRQASAFRPKTPPSPFNELDRYTAQTPVSAGRQQHKCNLSEPTLLEEIVWLFERSMFSKALCDELFAQTMKQLNGNTDFKAILRGWMFMAIALTFVAPSHALHMCLHDFIEHDHKSHGALLNRQEYTRALEYCQARLAHFQHYGAPPRRPLIQFELEEAEKAVFEPQVFGHTLEIIMCRQKHAYPSAPVPIILIFLTTALLQASALSTPGTWTTAGNTEKIARLRFRINKGRYNLHGILSSPLSNILDPQSQMPAVMHQQILDQQESDVSVLTSTLKMWLLELREPVFPVAMYSECLLAANSGARVIELCLKLPVLHLRVVIYLVGFLQLFLEPAVMAETGVAIQALADSIAPSLLHSPKSASEIVNNNANLERTFAETLLWHLPVNSLDPNFRPNFNDIL